MNITNYDEKIQDLIIRANEIKFANKRGRKTFCKQLLSEARKLKDDTFYAFAYYHMGDCLYTMSAQQGKAMYHIKKALMYAQQGQDEELLARVYNLLGIDASNHGLVELSLEYHLIARTYALKFESKELIGMISFNIGYSFMDMGNEESALKYFMSSYRYCKKCDKNNSLAWYCRYIICCVAGIIYIRNNKINRADMMMKEIQKLLEIRKSGIESVQDEPLNLIFHMAYYNAKGNEEDRNRYYNKMLSALDDYNLTVDGLPDIINFCEHLVKGNYMNEAYEIIEKLKPIMEKTNIPNISQAYYCMIMEYYDALGDEVQKEKVFHKYYENSCLKKEERKEAFSFYAEMMETVETIRLENERLVEQARTDSLTLLPNRLDMNEVSQQWFEKAYAEGKSLGVEILDVDKFKEYNDTYGHQVGDKCLEEIGKVLRSVSSDRIYAARYGGDEFLICYMGMTDEEILTRAKYIKDRMAEIRVPIGKKELVGISVSQGIRNSVPINKNKMWDYLYAADNALYELKQHNRGDILILHKTILSHKSLKDAIIDKS